MHAHHRLVGSLLDRVRLMPVWREFAPLTSTAPFSVVLLLDVDSYRDAAWQIQLDLDSKTNLKVIYTPCSLVVLPHALTRFRDRLSLCVTQNMLPLSLSACGSPAPSPNHAKRQRSRRRVSVVKKRYCTCRVWQRSVRVCCSTKWVQ